MISRFFVKGVLIYATRKAIGALLKDTLLVLGAQLGFKCTCC